MNSENLEQYRSQLILEMKKLGATKNEIELISDTLILNAINNNRKPEDVAWAVLQ